MSIYELFNALGLAKMTKPKMSLTSTSEMYEDLEGSPKSETYRVCVNTIGHRSYLE